MTYSSGGLIQATDYNGFVSTTAGANINDVWGTGSGDKGWGQTPLGTVSAAGTVTATQWASLVNTLTSMGSQTGTTLTSRTAPTAGQTVSILANVAADLTSVTTNRGSAAAVGTISSTWTGNIAQTAATGTTNQSWTLTWTQTVNFASAAAARYFWNAGGFVQLDMNKGSTGTDKDPDWNTFVGTVGSLRLSGRVNGAAQTIAGTSYTGFTRIGGSGTPSPNLTTTGWYSLTPGAAATTIWQLNSSVSPYSGDYIRVTAAVNSASTQLTLVTTWYSAGLTGAGETNNISGGTDTASPYTSFGTAPAVLCRYVPPATTYLTNSWGTPTVSSTVASAGYTASYVAIGGGGGGSNNGGGGGAGGWKEGVVTFTTGTVYTVTIGNGGAANTAGGNTTIAGSNISTITALGGGRGGVRGSAGVDGGSGGGGDAIGWGGYGTAGQGYDGGYGYDTGTSGGGGGAGGVGQNGNNPAGDGGVGRSTTITGATVTLAGGGGGGSSIAAPSGPGGGAGVNGGGSGGVYAGYNGSAGTANTGGGGGGSRGATAGAGGSGVVYISVPTASYTGTVTGAPTVTTNGSNTVMKFTATGTYTG